MASLNTYALVDIPITHDGTGNNESTGAGDIVVTYTYKSGCSHVPVINLGTGNAVFTTRTLSTAATPIVAAIDAKHTICIWGATGLVCSRCGIKTVDFTAAKQLITLDVLVNKLTTISTTGLTKLTLLRCSFNQITSLDLSTNTALVTLQCTGTAITSLVTTNNTALSGITCDINALASLDLSTNTALAGMNADSNALTTLSLINNPLITILRLRSNSLTQTAVNSILATLDSHGLSGGQLNLENQTTGAVINTGSAAATSAQSLITKGWTVTYSGTFVAA